MGSFGIRQREAKFKAYHIPHRTERKEKIVSQTKSTGYLSSFLAAMRGEIEISMKITPLKIMIALLVINICMFMFNLYYMKKIINIVQLL
jgi:hypothetical protein